MVYRNRYGELEFEEIPDGYKLKIPPHTRLGEEIKDEIFFVDPPGGPYICLGDMFMGKKVIDLRLEDDYIIIKLYEV